MGQVEVGTDRGTEGQTIERQIYRQTERTDMYVEGQTDSLRRANKGTDRQRVRGADRGADIQADSATNRGTDRGADRPQTDRGDRQVCM